MDKQTLVRDIKGEVKDGGFINISQIAKYMHTSRDKARELVEDLEYYPSGREKKFFISDVASKILKERRVGGY